MMAGWSIWWRIEPCGRIGAHRTTIRWWTILGDQAANARHGGSSQAIVTFLRDVPPCRQISSSLKVSYIGHCCYSLNDRASNGCNLKYLRGAQPVLGKNEAKKRMWQNSGGQTWTGLADIGSWSEGSSVVDFQEVLWSVGSFPTISVRAV